MTTHGSLETQLFSWKEWDVVDGFVFLFEPAILNRDIGMFRKGHKFDSATLDYSQGKLELRQGEQLFEYKLRLEVVNGPTTA